MKNYSFLTLFAFLIIQSFSQNTLPYKNPGLPVETRVQDLLQRMTAEEKFWQLFMITANPDSPKERYINGICGLQLREPVKNDSTGTMGEQFSSPSPSETARKINSIQKYLMEKTRLGIPAIFFEEALHGLVAPEATSFPQSIALAATFDTALMHRVANAIAEETKSRGIRQVLSPVVNIASDARWGRVEETYGEDPFLSSLMGVAFVAASEKTGVVTTPKHFLANAGDGGRDSYPIDLDERILEEVYLPPFRACIEKGGSRSVMASYNSLNGSPCTANNWLLNTKLKKEMHFTGFCISDANAVGGANVLHYTAPGYSEAGANAINNGLDVILQTDFDHFKLYQPAFLDGRIDPKAIDDAVTRVLRVKFELGLFDHPYVDEKGAANTASVHKNLAKEAALESIILLKNENHILPLTPPLLKERGPGGEVLKTLAVIGVDAVDTRLGGYSGPGNGKTSILDGIKRKLGVGCQVLYSPGCGRSLKDSIPGGWQKKIEDAVATAEKAEAVVIVAGITEGEGYDRAHLNLPGHQEEMINRIAQTGKPVIVVLVGGSAITMSGWIKNVNGILDVWYPGEEGGNAVADVLFGDYNPSGRLPITFPIAEGQLPLVYNHKPTGRFDDYGDLTGQPLFPFGYGLSYSTFEYSDLHISPPLQKERGIGGEAKRGPGGEVKKGQGREADSSVIHFNVKNNGPFDGDEVVQLYIRDSLASVARPVKELKGFQRIHLKAGESKEVLFPIGQDMLKMLNDKMEWVVEKGDFEIMIGASSKDIRLRGVINYRGDSRIAPTSYIWPADSVVSAKLHQWQDWKFGVLIHWGTYSEWGVVESWSLCPEDEPWCIRRGPWAKDYNTYKAHYEDIRRTFNPSHFNPQHWAQAAHDAGMKYVVFTTKHHDGFCMFDSKYTDYKITDTGSIFSKNAHCNVVKEVFSAFRQQGMGIGAYFSKPDWHSGDYWWPYFPIFDRNVNYDPALYPERWKNFQTFTYNQIEELMKGYGKVDILWLDGGWVRPAGSLDDETRPWLGKRQWIQDVNIPAIGTMARKYQPGLLIVDRTVHGEFENYRTPEQQIPESLPPYPWESCITLGDSWYSTGSGEHYKSVNWAIHTLIKIVAKGGNFLLGIGPDKTGELVPEVYERLKAIGEWMKVNGQAIYNSRPLAPYQSGNLCFTQSKDGNTRYLFFLVKENEPLPASIELPDIFIGKNTTLNLLGYSKKLTVQLKDEKKTVLIPDSFRRRMLSSPSLVFNVSVSE
jgi:beta-glucosidase-like glycosyl hydrolase/alpha-L-fucosidase